MAIYEDAGRKREFVVPIPYKPPPSKKALDGLFFKSYAKSETAVRRGWNVAQSAPLFCFCKARNCNGLGNGSDYTAGMVRALMGTRVSGF